HERAGADLVLRAGVLDAFGHALRDETRALRRIEELDDKRRIAMLGAGDLRAPFAQARRDDLRQREVRYAVLRERRRKLRGRDAPYLRRVRAEEEPVERSAHRLDDPVLGRHELTRPHASP